MTIYVSHATSYDYKNELYAVLRNSWLNDQFTFILPHETSSMQYETRQLFESGECDLLIAECSAPSTGQGIELGYADLLHIPIVCLFKQGAKVSGAVKTVTDDFLEYDGGEDLIQQLTQYLKRFANL